MAKHIGSADFVRVRGYELPVDEIRVALKPKDVFDPYDDSVSVNYADAGSESIVLATFDGDPVGEVMSIARLRRGVVSVELVAESVTFLDDWFRVVGWPIALPSPFCAEDWLVAADWCEEQGDEQRAERFRALSKTVTGPIQGV